MTELSLAFGLLFSMSLPVNKPYTERRVVGWARMDENGKITTHIVTYGCGFGDVELVVRPIDSEYAAIKAMAVDIKPGPKSTW